MRVNARRKRAERLQSEFLLRICLSVWDWVSTFVINVYIESKSAFRRTGATQCRKYKEVAVGHPSHLRQQALDHVAVHVCQPKVAALKPEGEPRMLQAQQM